MKLFTLCVLIISISSCSFIESFQRENYRKKQERELANLDFGEEIELYYGGKTVGTAVFEENVIEYSEFDYDIEYTVREEIHFKDQRFRFVFVLGAAVSEIRVLRYANNSDTLFRPNDSYAVVNNAGGVYHKYFGPDGKEVIAERQITDPQIVTQTQALFTYCNEYLGSYFMMIEDKRARALRRNRIQSLGYELLQFERI